MPQNLRKGAPRMRVANRLPNDRINQLGMAHPHVDRESNVVVLSLFAPALFLDNLLDLLSTVAGVVGSTSHGDKLNDALGMRLRPCPAVVPEPTRSTAPPDSRHRRLSSVGVHCAGGILVRCMISLPPLATSLAPLFGAFRNPAALLGGLHETSDRC